MLSSNRPIELVIGEVVSLADTRQQKHLWLDLRAFAHDQYVVVAIGGKDSLPSGRFSRAALRATSLRKLPHGDKIVRTWFPYIIHLIGMLMVWYARGWPSTPSIATLRRTSPR